MLTDTIIYSVVFVGLIIGTYTDFKKREVPDWVNYGLIAAGFSINLLFTAIFWKLNFIISSVIGFAMFFVIAMLMFYTGQWGGGDAKMLMALGALIGFKTINGIPFLVQFLINIFIIGAVYGILWIIYLILRHSRKFIKKYKEFSKKIKNTKIMVFIISLLLLISLFMIQDNITKLYISALIVIGISTFYLWLVVKVIEKITMVKLVSPLELTEGDWIAKDIIIKGRLIATAKKRDGLSKKQIEQLAKLYKQKKIKKVLIKEGIPFVPSFLLAFIITLFLGDLVTLLMVFF